MHNTVIRERESMHRVSLWFIAVKVIHETPIWNVEAEGCDHINEKCHEAPKPKPHVYTYMYY